MWRNGTPLDSRVVHGVTGHLSICMWNLRVFLDDAPGCHCPFVLCLDPQDCLRVGFCTGFLSRADQGIGVFWHAAPPTRLCLEFPRETGLILMCARKVGNAFQTKQGNRTSCRDQEGRRVSDEVVPGTSVFSSSETGMSGNFWGRIKGSK